jgi:tetratricopeptide (TPR) repeat protein
LLALHAGLAWVAEAEDLCQDLGYHPYAVEIAGRHLKQYSATPAELREHLADAPHDLAMPGGLATPERESIKRLLDRTYDTLDSADARAALRAFGALHSGSATVELLATYLGLSQPRTSAALNRLADVSLAKRLPGTSVYEVHDLTFSYARALRPPSSIAAVAQFVQAHSRSYHLLEAEMDNLLGAAAAARSSDPDSFLAIVETLAVGGYLDDHGHTLGLLRLIDDAVDRVADDPGRCHMLLTKRGNALYNQGERAEAVQVYRRALALAPTAQRRAILLGVLGKVLAESGEHGEAGKQFQRAYAIADETRDLQIRLRILEQHSVAAFRQHDYHQVRALTTEGLELSRQLGARFQEAIFLNNLGTAEFELGVCAAIERHSRAQEIAVELDNDHVLALTHRTLGADFQAQENHEQAGHHFAAALRLYASLGQRERETNLRHLMRQFGYLEGAHT